jgi:hypothetical protein
MKLDFDLLPAAVLISFTLLIVGPAQIYFGNPNEFLFAFGAVVPLLAVAAACLALLLALPLSLLPRRLRAAAVAAGCGVAFLFWVQGNFLVWRGGPLAGRPIDWAAHGTQAFLESALWMAVLAACLVASGPIVARRRSIVGLLFAVNALSLAVLVGPSLFRPGARRFYVDDREKFAFSSTRNVIVLVLDTFQTDVFQEIVNERPELREVFRGFTYFRNAVGGYSLTLPSIPLMLTGQYYENSMPYRDFVRQAFAGDSVPAVLRRNGYTVDLFPSSGAYLVLDPRTASNASATMPFSERVRGASFLTDLSLFRYVPHHLKRHVYASKWTLRGWLFGREPNADLTFFENMRAARAGGEAGRFKFFHLWGLHAPLAFDENLEERAPPMDKRSYKSQAVGFVKLLAGFLEKLRQLGIYDDSMIVIAGDHGTSGYGVRVNLEASGHREGWRADRAVARNADIVESGIPLLLIKPFEAGGELQVSDVPVSHADLPRTIARGAGIMAFEGQASVWDQGGQERRRRFLAYAWTPEYWSENPAYFPPLDEYWVTGFSWLRSSWQPAFRRFTKGGIQSSRPTPLPLPATLAFGDAGNASNHLGMGWAAPDKDFNWTEGTRSALILPLGPRAPAVRMRAWLTPLSGVAKGKPQRVRTLVNGRTLGEWTVAAHGTFENVLTGAPTAEGDLNVEFQLPDAVSPTELGLTGDSRQLGVAFYRIELTPVPYYELGTLVRFGTGGNAAPYQQSGWSVPEAGYTWTDGGEARLVLPLREPASLRLDLSLTPLVDDRKRRRQRIVVKANDRRVDAWAAGAAGQFTATIPKELLSGAVLNLDFELPDATSPSALGRSSDARVLAAAFHTLTLSPVAR